MRLLKCSSDGDITLTEQLIGYNIPTYAILSHTWGHATEEVTFKDLVNNTGRHKAGYDKIRFCADQATRDGLQYFWVDTCCIDKSDNNELSEAINSMFRWYQNAARCYVYLSNISMAGYEPDPAQPQPAWDAAFRASRWFTRGWTLQELLAPISVEFFTREGWRLGDKRSLEQQIHEITGITVSALRGTPLSQFDVDQRFKWVETRQTTRDEDWAYCLLGIFGVFMPLIYGEGRENALRRLRKEIDEALSREGMSLQSTQSGHGENVKNTASNFTAKRLDALEQKVDSVSAHSAPMSDLEQRKRSIWKDGFDHGFHLDKVPLINSFIGRQDDVANIERYLLSDIKLIRRRVYVVSGIGGMGKTQLAVEFARRHQSDFSSIFFIDGSSKDALLQSFIRIFRRLAVNDIKSTNPRSEKSGIESSTPEGITEKALEWFSMEGNNRWLLIYDNVDLEPTDPGGFALESFFPTRDCGSIVVTTRLASLRIAGTVKRLGELDAPQSIELLTETSMADNVTRACSTQLKLVEDLGGLPLAISQAGKLMKSLGIDVEEYIELYTHSKRKVIDMLQPEALPNDLERASIRTTWTTSANILKQRMAGEDELGPQHCAYRLLHLFVYFNSLDLDYELLQNTKLVNNPPAWILKVFESKLDFYSTVKILLDLSLIDKTNTNGVYSMHRVVFDWLSIYEAHETQEELLNVAAAAIAWACPITYVPVFWAESQQRLILHANVLHQRLRGHGSLVRPVWYGPMRKADLKLAAILWECDVDSLRHGRVYQPIGDIARLISTGGKPEEALDLIEDAIAHTISCSPERDLSYYVLLYEKASMLADSSLSEEAYTILLEAVRGFQRLQAPYWLVCAHILEGCPKPDAESAIQSFETALTIGKDAGFCIFYNPTWLAFDNIDRDLQWQLCDKERRRVHLESVKGEALRRGYDLPNARVALRNLAFLYVELGLRAEAEPLYLKLLEWQVRRHGPDASEVISSVQELAWFYFNQASIKSIKYDWECLRLAELHHGPTSREAEMAHLFLGESYEKHGQTTMARRYFTKAWEINQDSKASATQKLILNGLVRVSIVLRDEENVIKYHALQRELANNKSEYL